MAQWDNYSQKSTPADTDTLMLKDNAATGKPNKRLLFSGLWTWIVDKLTNAAINALQTTTKTVVGGMNNLQDAVTTLNSKNYTDQASGNSLLDFVATLDKGTYNFRLDNAPEAPVTGGVIYTIKKTHPVNDTRCSIIATAMNSSDPDIYSAFVGQNSTSITWKKAAKQSDVDVLNSNKQNFSGVINDTRLPSSNQQIENVSIGQSRNIMYVGNNDTINELIFQSADTGSFSLSNLYNKLLEKRSSQRGSVLKIVFNNYATGALIFGATSNTNPFVYVYSNGYLAPVVMNNNINVELSSDYKTVTITNNTDTALYIDVINPKGDASIINA